MSRRVVLGVCAVAILLLSGCGAWRSANEMFEDDAQLTGKITAVRVENGAGDVKIRSGGGPSVHRKVSYAVDKPGPTHRIEGETLVLQDCQRRNCWIDYHVVLPAGAKVLGELGSGALELTGMTDVSMRSGSGDVTVRASTGPVTVNIGSGKTVLSDIEQAAVVETGSGDVTLTNMRGPVTVESGSGGVDGRGLGGNAVVKASSGDIALDMASPHAVKATASSGNVTVKVPKGSEAYKVTATTDSGDEKINVASDPAGKNALELETGSGDVTVDYR